ncbi:unnamed protein product [Anisakis simplex]|uniref:RBR-type E3 ubiquitin transferase n=1 Tax=Anisakis simplex TaxID=6269 RepID=A0A0M3JNI6_ANISI|nr:unnamed protein product [Anisakis simplex]
MVKKCPFCGTFCERSEGCNHMTCTCGEAFCYVCGGKWNQDNHYECDVDVSVRVYMFDVSDVNIGYISMKTLDECLEYRRLKSATNLWALQKKLVTILGDNPAEVRRTVSLYSTVS